MTKDCTHPDCQQDNPQPFDAFYAVKKHADGLSFYCRKCSCRLSKEYEKRRAQSPGFYAEKSRRYVAKRKGTPEWKLYCKWVNIRRYWPGCSVKEVRSHWKKLFEQQGGLCGSCQEPKELVVDHCHSTGTVRGLICSGCNLAIGHLSDDPKKALLLCRYLKRAA